MREQRDKLLLIFGEKDENGQIKLDEENDNAVRIPDENMTAFYLQYKELMETTITLTLSECDKPSAEVIECIQGLTMTPAEAEAITLLMSWCSNSDKEEGRTNE